MATFENYILASIIVFAQMSACVGFGAALFRLIGIEFFEKPWEGFVCAFAFGMGFLGWGIFFLGIAGCLNNIVLGSFLAIGVAGLIFFNPSLMSFSKLPTNFVLVAQIFFLILVALLDLFEAMTPPGEADSLAYHFVLPKQFLEIGRIDFVHRALDGAVPLLVQMTYLPVFGLGGEVSLMLWTCASSWFASFSVFVLARRYLDINWAITLVVIFATTPAIIYGGGSGQVEGRLVLFVVSAILILTREWGKGVYSHIFLIALFAGFFVGGKYLGLFFAIVCGLAVFVKRMRFSDLLMFGAILLLSGSQWYIWNAVNTGDPFFPMLYEWFGDTKALYWGPAHQKYLINEFIPKFKIVPSNIYWLFGFPIKITLSGTHGYSSGTTGLGFAMFLLFPFAILGWWRSRRRVWSHPLFTLFYIFVLFYVFWFFSDSPQVSRFLIPVYPLLMVSVFFACARLQNDSKTFKPLCLALGFIMILQLGGQFIYNLKSAKYVLGDETRQDYLLRTISNFKPVPWINQNLNNNSRLFTVIRHYLYYINVPYFYANEVQQAFINLLPSANNFDVFITQMESQGITHVLASDFGRISESGRKMSSYEKLGLEAVFKKCLLPEKQFLVEGFSSRSLPKMNPILDNLIVYKFYPNNCKGE